MEPMHSTKAFEESPQLSSEISLNLDDETSEKTSCWQKFRSLKRKYHCILITTLLVFIASMAIGIAFVFSTQSGDEPAPKITTTLPLNPGKNQVLNIKGGGSNSNLVVQNQEFRENLYSNNLQKKN